MQLFDIRMHDGSRHFTDAPEIVSWDCLRDHLAQLPGAEITGYVTDHITEVWIDFTFQGYRFSVNNQHGDYWFFAEDPDTPEFTLLRVMAHCEPLFD